MRRCKGVLLAGMLVLSMSVPVYADKSAVVKVEAPADTTDYYMTVDSGGVGVDIYPSTDGKGEKLNEIAPLIKREGFSNYDFVGPICESSDIFASDRECALLEAGDYVALLDAGAYGYSMAGNYNSRPLIAQIMVDKDKNYIIRKEQSFEDMIKDELL